jgi:hypothetical protein
MYWRKIEKLKLEVEIYLMKNGWIHYYTPLGCFAKTLEWLDLGNFNQVFMIKDIRERFMFVLN